MESTHETIQRRRLLQLSWLTVVALALLSIKLFYDRVPIDASLVLSAAIALSSVPFLVKKGRQQLGASLFVVILAFLLLLIMWTSGGIRDNATLAIPAVLLFAALTGANRLLIPLLIFFSLNVLVMGWGNQRGIFAHVGNEQSIASALDMVFILCLSAAATLSVTRDNVKLLKSLQKRVSQQAASQKELEFVATHDALTGLPNRLAAEQQFKQMLARLDRSQEHSAAVFFIDLDDFKSINDTLGHSMGDRFLVAIADRLKETFRADDEFFRIGGDEFLVYAQNYGSGRNIMVIAEKLQNALSTPVVIDEHQLKASGSIGIVMVPRDAQNYENAVKRADIAMYRAKEQGKNCFHFYNEDMETELLKQYELETSILKGLEREEFSVFYQPIVDLETGDYVGAEALLRWQHEELGMVPPDVFIPIAEKTTFIDDLCKFVLTNAHALIEELPKHYSNFYISVNLSAVQVSRKNLEEQLFSCVPDHILNRFKMEMTESQIIENIDVYEENIQSMKQKGMGIFLDDFGTGYSNLGYLQRLKFDTVKIDKSFTRNIHSALEKQPVIRAISNMAREMGMTVVAEGVENEAELVALRNLKIAYGQGYYWSKPVPKTEFLKKI